MSPSNWPFIINVGNSIIGVTVLAMPFCFKTCGIILATLMLFFSSWLTVVSCQLLMKAGVTARRRSFSLLAHYTHGASGKLIVEIGMIGLQLGTLVAQVVIIGDLGPAIVSKATGLQNTDNLRTGLIIFLCLFIGLPLALLKDVRTLSKTSTLCIVFYSFFTVYVVLLSLPNLVANNWYSRVYLWRFDGFFQCLPIFSFAFGCQTQLFIVYDALSEPSLKRINSIVGTAVNMCTVCYLLVGFFGYIAFSRIEEISGDIINHFQENAVCDVIKLCFVVSIAVSIPLICFPCRASLYTLLFPHKPKDEVPGSGKIPEFHFQLITLCIVCGSMIIGILIPNIEFVLGLNGATMGTLICYIFPALFFMNVMSDSSERKLTGRLVLFFGLTIMIASTYTTLNTPTPETKVAKMEPVLEQKDLSPTVLKDIIDVVEQGNKLVEDTKNKRPEKDAERHEPPNPQEPDEVKEKPQLPREKELNSDGRDADDPKAVENVIKDDVEKPEAPPDDHKISEGEKENEKAVNLDKKADETVGIKDKKQKDVKKEENKERHEEKKNMEEEKADGAQQIEVEKKQEEILAKLEHQQEEAEKILQEQREILEQLKEHQEKHKEEVKEEAKQLVEDTKNQGAKIPVDGAVGNQILDQNLQNVPGQLQQNNIQGQNHLGNQGQLNLQGQGQADIQGLNNQGQLNLPADAQGNVGVQNVLNNQAQLNLPGQGQANIQGQMVQNGAGQLDLRGQIPADLQGQNVLNNQGQLNLQVQGQANNLLGQNVLNDQGLLNLQVPGQANVQELQGQANVQGQNLLNAQGLLDLQGQGQLNVQGQNHGMQNNINDENILLKKGNLDKNNKIEKEAVQSRGKRDTDNAEKTQNELGGSVNKYEKDMVENINNQEPEQSLKLEKGAPGEKAVDQVENGNIQRELKQLAKVSPQTVKPHFDEYVDEMIEGFKWKLGDDVHAMGQGVIEMEEAARVDTKQR